MNNKDSLNSQDRWEIDKKDFGWKMPECAPWKRLPVIRHFRAIGNAFALMAWRGYWNTQGYLGCYSGYDTWVLYGIWRGWD